MKVVVAIDSVQSAKTALAFLTNSKYGPGDEMYLVHVISPPGFADVVVAGIPDVVAQEQLAEQKILGEMASTIKEKLNIDATIDILTGNIAASLIKAIIPPFCKSHKFRSLTSGPLLTSGALPERSQSAPAEQHFDPDFASTNSAP